MSSIRELLDAVLAGEKAARSALYDLDREDVADVPALIAAIPEVTGDARVMAVRALGQIGAREASATLIACLEDANEWVRCHALISLARVGWSDDVATALIARLLADAHPMTRVGAAGALAQQRGAPDAILAVLALDATAKSVDVATGSWALSMLVETIEVAPARVVPLLVDLLDHWSDEFRETIARAVRELDAAVVVPPLLDAYATSTNLEQLEGILLVFSYLGERARPSSAALTELVLGELASPLYSRRRDRIERTLHELALDRDRVAATLEVLASDPRMVDVLACDVRVHPEDLAARLRYARCLDAIGDPRGELIRRAIASPDDRRVAALIETYGGEWIAEFPDAHYIYRHGLPWHATVRDLVGFVSVSRWTFPGEHPIASLTLHVDGAPPGALDDVVDEWETRLLDLRLVGQPSDEVLAAVARLGRSSRLRALDLYGCATDAAVRTLVDLQAPLAELSLDPAPSTAILEILANGALPKLRVLALRGAFDDPDATIEIVELP